MNEIWRNLRGGEGAHYSVFELKGDGMEALRLMFPTGDADYMNAVLFSTSGVHGHYGTIEEAERHLAGDEDASSDVTFVVIQPRLVTIRYGNVEPQNATDIAYLKKLRASSHAEIAQIGVQP
jgi:hypothetical protein